MTSKYRTAPMPITTMPKGIPYIIGNEAAERFSFYGMKTILFTFMTSTLMYVEGSSLNSNMSTPEATFYVHLFVWAVYFLSFFGAILSDVLLGKYLTIMSLSIVYCVGHGVLAFMGITGVPIHWLAIGLILISIGSGGIKPCVSAHVGDQFGKTNSHLLTKIFGWFYFSINMGAFASTLLTPLLLRWYGPHWAFGVPGVLMLIATIAFWMGRKVFIHVPPGGSQAFFGEAFSKSGLVTIGKIIAIFLFAIPFWALFDQTGSRWISQAENMDRRWLGIDWLPEQFQAFNPLMIMAFIPLFQYVVYPQINRFFKLTPLRKITIGFFLMAGAFSIVAFTQQMIDAGERPSFGWQVLAYVVLTSAEVMVSITFLEFSYTQAPRKMKSLIMALFLMTVAFGNLLTAVVNMYIIIPSDVKPVTQAVQPLIENVKRGVVDIASVSGNIAEADAAWVSTPGGHLLVKVPAKEGGINSPDAVEIVYSGATAQRVDIRTRTNKQLTEALVPIEESWRSEQKLPTTKQGQSLIKGHTDAWGNQIRYRLQTSKTLWLRSDGPDGVPFTADDVNMKINRLAKNAIEKEEDEKKRAQLKEGEEKTKTWIEKRKEEMGLANSNPSPTSDTDKSTPDLFSTEITVGGGERLQGADYYWFFTLLMLVTACLFVIVAWFYKPREYLQEEATA